MIGRVAQWHFGTRLTLIFNPPLVYNLCYLFGRWRRLSLTSSPRFAKIGLFFNYTIKFWTLKIVSLWNHDEQTSRSVASLSGKGAEVIGPARGLVWTNLSVLRNVSWPPVVFQVYWSYEVISYVIGKVIFTSSVIWFVWQVSAVLKSVRSCDFSLV